MSSYINLSSLPEPTLQISTARTPDNQRLGTDFLPVLDSPSAHARGSIVFVGYGMSIPLRTWMTMPE